MQASLSVHQHAKVTACREADCEREPCMETCARHAPACVILSGSSHLVNIFWWHRRVVHSGQYAVQIKLVHLNNTGPDLLPLKTSRLFFDKIYQKLDKREKLAIWEEGKCVEELKRPIVVNQSETFHHYCEEFWFKTSVDIVLNMTAVIPAIDNLFENYFPSLQLDDQALPVRASGHRGTSKISQGQDGSENTQVSHPHVLHHRQKGFGTQLEP